MTLAIKAYLIVVEDCTDLFSASLNILFFYKEEETPTLPFSLDRSSSSLSTPEPDNYGYDEFVSIVIKNEIGYAAAVEFEEMQYNHGLAHNIVVLIIDQEFLLIGYWLDTLRSPPLKSNVPNAIGVCYSRLPLKIKIKDYTDQIQVKICHLNILISHGCYRMSDFEAEIKHIETLEA